MKEIWKDIDGYKGYYKVSNLGRVMSLERKVNTWYGERTEKEKILKQSIVLGYHVVNLSYENIQKLITVHKLVAIGFLNHKPNGHKIEVDHKNKNKTDNKASNLQLLTTRNHRKKDLPKGKSKYRGVSWNNGNWGASIWFEPDRIFLGNYKTEKKASNAYEKALKNIDLYGGDKKRFRELLDLVNKRKTSKYVGVSWNTKSKTWVATYSINGKTKYIGRFKTEIEADKAIAERTSTT